MKLAIDLQCLQNGNRFRGIGRYASSLTEAIVAAAPSRGIEVHLIASKWPTTPISSIRRRFSSLDNVGRLHVFDGLTHLLNPRGSSPSNWTKELSGRLKSRFLSELGIDASLDLSPFDGWATGVAASSQHQHDLTSFAVVHDLIPLLSPKDHLADRNYREFYFERLKELRHMSGLIANSENSRSEALEHVGVDPDRVIVAYGDADAIFSPSPLDSSDTSRVSALIGGHERYLLYCGALDARKNVSAIVDALSLLPESKQKGLKLVISGKATPDEEKQLKRHWAMRGLPADALRFLGYTSDADLVRLYKGAAIFVFPSRHEGFGLPVLEAIRCGTPVLVSNVTSLPEIAVAKASRFDPLSLYDLTQRLEIMLDDDAIREQTVQENLEHSSRFSWTQSAEAVLDLVQRNTLTQPRSRQAASSEDKIEDFLRFSESLPRPTTEELAALAVAITWNNRTIDRASRARRLPKRPVWRMEGPFDSSYSLSIVNRNLALALDRAGADVRLVSSEGNGDFFPSAAFLKRNLNVARLHYGQTRGQADIVSRNMFPPKVDDIDGGLRLLHSYGWEESAFPSKWVRNVNLFLDGITTISKHVAKILRDAGVEIEIHNVGIGVDHLPISFTAPSERPHSALFEILHVSSCFPRKGVDLLLEAFARAFTRLDQVRLTIKTFPNPHNKIEEQITKLSRRYPNLAPITLINRDISEKDLSALYQRSSVVVLPSRAEGFCLPAAEAILAGRPVIITGWGGQMEFADLPMVRLIDFDFVPAESHLVKFGSVWAEPRIDHLVELMRAAYETPAPDADIALSSRETLLERFSWDAVAERSLFAVANIAAHERVSPPKIAVVSTFNTKCGIAEFTSHLLDAIQEEVTVFAPHDAPLLTKDPFWVIRCWRQGDRASVYVLRDALLESDTDVVVIQFNYGFFDFEALAELIQNLHRNGKLVVVHLHSTRDPAGQSHKKLSILAKSLSDCAALIVHSHNDLNRLKRIGLVDNVVLLPHGILDLPQKMPAKSFVSGLTFSTYGFFLPQKGLDVLIEAVAILHRRGLMVRLKMLNAAYPAPESDKAICDALVKIRELKLDNFIELETAFLSDEEVISRLRETDAAIFPYRPTGESASGAVRHAIAAGLPTFVTPLPIFSEFGAAVFRFRGNSAEDIAEGLANYAEHLGGSVEYPIFERMARAADEWRSAHGYSLIARRYLALLRQLHNSRVREL